MVTLPNHAALVLSYVNEVKTGNVLNGRYLLEDLLGSGGMGSVYAARHIKLGTRVAIKVLRPELLSDAEAIERFAREARAVAKISDENVVRVLDVGQLDSGAPYLVMEFLEGQDGGAYLKQHGRLTIEQTLDVMLQLCAAVAAAHAMDIIHRDIKPSNLFFVARTGGRTQVKMLDFGVSKLVSPAGQNASRVTKTGSILGSPGYIPPEQWFTSRSADKRSDIWALGVLFYELATGQLPFDGDTMPVLAAKIAYDPPTPPRALREDIPVDVATVMLCCLEKEPDNRFQEVAALAKALGSCQRRYQTLNSSQANEPIQVGVPSKLHRRWPFALSKRNGAIALAGLLIGGAGALVHTRGTGAVRPDEGHVSQIAAPTSAPAVSAMVAVPAVLPPSPPPGEVNPATKVASPAPPGARPKAASASVARRARLASDDRKRRAVDAGANAAHCKPPYFFNAQGIRVFKVECL